MKNRLLFLSGVMLGLAACAPISLTPDPAQVALAAQSTLQVVGTHLAVNETLTATALRPTDTATPTITPTATQTPSPTSTLTNTPTPLPNGIVKDAGPLRAGPDRVFPVVKQLVGGEVLLLLGQTASGDWFSVMVEDGTPGWLPLSNFDFPGDLTAIPILTDLPPTPTLPPPTWTPLPTPTNTPSPYTCDFYIQHSAAVGEILLIGTHWPPNVDLTVTITLPPNPYGYPSVWGQSDANGAFQFSTPDRPGITRQFTVSTSICSRTVQFP